jgi:hypothetical protein
MTNFSNLSLLSELTQDELDEVNGAFLHGAALVAGAYLLGF